MSLGILGKKIGMEQLFDPQGNSLAATLVESGPCFISQVKTVATDGYCALQICYDDAREKRVNKAKKGHFAKAKVASKRYQREFRIAESEIGNYQLGQELPLDFIKPNEYVDVTGVTIGKGFAGVIKRHHMKGNPASHGTHEYFRHPGSAGCRFPQGTIKGKRNPGHLGVDQVTIQNLKLVEIRDGQQPNQKVLVISGAIPGHRGSYVVVKKAIKIPTQIH